MRGKLGLRERIYGHGVYEILEDGAAGDLRGHGNNGQGPGVGGWYMKYPLTIGTTTSGEKVCLPIEALRRHVLALGASGSGKTVFCKVIVEECIRRGLPVIAVDPQGDLASLALAEDPDVLVRMGVDASIAKKFHDSVDLKIWTPGATVGIPISMAPNMSVPFNIRREDRVRAYGAVAQSLAATLGTSDEATSVAFSMILEYADDNSLVCDSMDDFMEFLSDPPAPLARSLDAICDPRMRAKMHKSFLVKLLGANRLLFDLGSPIDIPELLGLYGGGPSSQGKARLSIIYLNTLGSQEDKEAFVAALCAAMYKWMLTLNGSSMWGLLYLDEVAPYLPPVKNPASKQALMMLLRQARKYGVCCMLATQSPGDIDYKALGQVGTMALGRITGERALSKVAPVLRSQPGLDTEDIIDGLPGMPCGRFVLMNPDHYSTPMETQVRWLVTKHATVPADHIVDMVSDEDRERFGA